LLPNQLEILRTWPDDTAIHNSVQLGYNEAVMFARALKMLPTTGPLGLSFRFRTSAALTEAASLICDEEAVNDTCEVLQCLESDMDIQQAASEVARSASLENSLADVFKPDCQVDNTGMTVQLNNTLYFIVTLYNTVFLCSRCIFFLNYRFKFNGIF
jgi:hypothetical protein